MVCFCHAAATTVPSAYSKMKLDFSPPKIPLALRLAVSLPVLADAERIDLKLAPMMQRIRTPNITPASGPLLALVAQLKLVGGTFVIEDIPMLRMQMRQSAASFNSHILPKVQMLASVKLPPLLQLAMVARLKLALDPVVFNALLTDGPKSAQGHGFNTLFALKPPQVQLGWLLAGIPGLVTLGEKMNIPFGDSSSPRAFQNRLNMLADLKPPSLRISLAVLMKICAVLFAFATIKAAFGEKALTPTGLTGIAATLNTLMRVPLPSPLPDLSMMPMLDGLPQFDDVKYGANTPHSALGYAFPTPKLAIMPFLMAMFALRGGLNAYFPFDPIRDCGACSMPVGAFA